MASVKAVEFIQGMIGKYPELLMLTGSANATPEATFAESAELSIGQTLFPHLAKTDLIEFDRTVLGLLALHWVLSGAYGAFTACQKGDDKLEYAQFKALRDFTLRVLCSPERIEALEVYLVINDLGKVKSLVEMMEQKVGMVSVDHDLILAEALRRFPEVSPSFSSLSNEYQQSIISGIASGFNLGQFVQAENVTASLAGLNQVDRKSFDFFAVHSLFDTAGAAGHAVQNGSAVFSNSTVGNYMLAVKIIQETVYEPSCPKYAAYDRYLYLKAVNLALLNERESQEDMIWAVARLCCQTRISQPEKAKQLLEVFEKLPRNTQAILVKELNKKGTDDGWAILIYYAPALLLNLKRTLLPPEENKIYFALCLLARLYQHARILIRRRAGNGIFTVMASEIAKVAAENPMILESMDFRLVSIGENDAKAELVAMPEVDDLKFPRISMPEVVGKRIAFAGIGGGSDCIQAAILAKMMETDARISVAAVISIRSQNTQSQNLAGAVGVSRTVENFDYSPGKDVYKLKPESTGSGRFLENLPATFFPTYLVVESANVSLADQLQMVVDECGADTVIAVDTGGDALCRQSAEDSQDVRSLLAISQLNCLNKLSCEIAVGVDAPFNAEQVLFDAKAECFTSLAEFRQLIMGIYEAWDFAGNSDTRFGKTPLAWQAALNQKFGWQALDLPTCVVLDEANPWMPFVYIQSSMSSIFFMDLKKHLAAIGC
jgi:hypothetical protein